MSHVFALLLLHVNASQVLTTGMSVIIDAKRKMSRLGCDLQKIEMSAALCHCFRCGVCTVVKMNRLGFRISAIFQKCS